MAGIGKHEFQFTVLMCHCAEQSGAFHVAKEDFMLVTGKFI